MWYSHLNNYLLHGTNCLELFQFDWFLPNYSLKIFHKLKFMTLFFFQFFYTKENYNWTGEPEIYHLAVNYQNVMD